MENPTLLLDFRRISGDLFQAGIKEERQAYRGVLVVIGKSMIMRVVIQYRGVSGNGLLAVHDEGVIWMRGLIYTKWI